MEDFTCFECAYYDDEFCVCTFQERDLDVSPNSRCCGDFELHELLEVMINE